GEAKVNPKSVEERRNSISLKCHPAMFDLAQLWRDSIEAFMKLGPNPSKKAIAEIESRFDAKLEEIRRQHSGAVPPDPNRFAAQIIFSKAAIESESDALGVAEQLHWQRHRVAMRHDVARLAAPDWDVSCRVQCTVSDLEQLRCGQGPIQAPKVDLEHGSLFEVLWGFGIERLTSEELAVFFDDACTCGCEAHDPEMLSRQRLRFRRALERNKAADSPG